MIDLSIDFVSVRNLGKAFDALDAKVNKKIVKKSVRNGIKIVLAATRSNINNFLGHGAVQSVTETFDFSVNRLREMMLRFLKIGVWSRRYQKGGFGMNMGFHRDGNIHFVYHSEAGVRSYIPSAIEYGHSGPNRAGGSIVARPVPYMRKAFEETKGKVINTVIRDMWRGIEREAPRIARRFTTKPRSF